MKPINLLLIEDNEGDILLTKEAFEDSSMIAEIDVVKDGMAAINYFNKVLEDTTLTLPDLVLLDINLPKKNGQEVLTFIKDTEQLKHIPVIMLTTSSAEKDIIESYRHYANCFITKPVDVNDFIEVISQVENFWFNITQLPHLKSR